MFIDARSLADATTIDADIAIIGGGAAGITLAREFLGTTTRVCLIEAGGFEFDPEGQTLYQGENTGIEYSLSGTRLRYFGGSSNHWGGFCRPLDPIDFEARDWVAHSGWPFGRAELERHYERATEIVEVAPAHFADADFWHDATGETILTSPTGRLEPQFVHYSPTRFGRRYREDLEHADSVRVLLHANVVDIATAAGSRAVSHLAIKTLTGSSHTVTAKIYVLATGGLENARTLLLSNHTHATGLGNQNDLVGRYFMEHPHWSGFGEIVVANPERIALLYDKGQYFNRHRVSVALKPQEPFLRQRKLLNATFQFGFSGRYQAKDAVPHGNPERASAHIDMLRATRRFIADGKTILNAADPSRDGVWMGTGCSGEQVPNPDSRVSLGSQRDALGLPRIRLDWKLTEQDLRSLLTHMHSLANDFGALGLGRIAFSGGDRDSWPDTIAGGCHHMGTTRMHDDPRHGVVDRNCQVHGIENLFVAGSSVFPTSGTANPTLTIVALTLRLAEHLRGTRP